MAAAKTLMEHLLGGSFRSERHLALVLEATLPGDPPAGMPRAFIATWKEVRGLVALIQQTDDQQERQELLRHLERGAVKLSAARRRRPSAEAQRLARAGRLPAGIMEPEGFRDAWRAWDLESGLRFRLEVGLVHNHDLLELAGHARTARLPIWRAGSGSGSGRIRGYARWSTT